VYQGDQDKSKGVYHINLVDEVTQFEITFATEKISERYLIPGLNVVLARLPFKIKGFHSDNGSEFINRAVADLLKKLHVEFTKSRARQNNDNGLAESKNASVIRKHFGYSRISQHWENGINSALQEPLYRYQNFHRPWFFSENN
jgi:transposase InsO family protein